MSNSPLVSFTRISPNSTNPRNKKIDRITIHHMAGDLTVESCGASFADPNRQASSNYGIGSDGRIGLYVEEKNRSWCSGGNKPNEVMTGRDNDFRAITIEVANDSREPDWHISDKALESTIELCVDICQRNGIEKLNFTGDATGNLTLHNFFAYTLCPGPYLESKIPYIVSEVNARLGISEMETTTEAQPEKEEVKEEAPVKSYLPELASGSNGKTVKALQILLIGYNCSCGSAGADGIFGSGTRGGVLKFQKANGLSADGVVGPKTWAKLLGMG